MADKKISQLTAATTPVAGTEEVPVVQSGETRRVTIDNFTKGRTVNATTFDTDVAAAGVTLSGTTLAADGTDANIDINVTPKGTGEAVFPKLRVDNIRIDGNTVVSTNTNGSITLSPDGTGAVGTTKTFIIDTTQNTDGQLRVSNATTRASGNKYGFRFADSTFETNGAIYIEQKSSGNNAAEMAFVINDATGGIQITSGTEFARGYGSGNFALPSGNLVIGTSGKGIDFSATSQATGMTSELLSDYEEGTWTPEPTKSGGTLSATYTSSGTYTKIGRLVFITGIINITAIASETGNYIVVGGLPFSTALTSYQIGGLVMKNDAVTTNTMLKVASAGSQLFAGTNKKSSFPPENDFWTLGEFSFSMTYYV